MLKPKRLLEVLSILLLLVACKPPEKIDLNCKLPNINNPASQLDNLTISVYVDGTPSMEGYVIGNTPTNYGRTLKLLDSVFSLKSRKVEYKRLGTEVQSISREQYQTDAQSPNFYNGENPRYPLLSVSQIEKAIKPQAKNNQLNVIITDLYQKNTDITKVSQEIKKNFLNSEQLQQGYAVGIMAIKSQFQGTVYTEEEKISKFAYSTQGKNSAKYHPFYIIFLGKYADIADYFSQINKEIVAGGNSIIDSHSVIFSSQYFIKNRLQFKDLTSIIPTTLDIRQPLSINNGKVVIDKSESIELLEIGKKEEQEITINHQASLNSLDYTLPFDYNSIKSQIEVKTFDSEQVIKTPDSSGKQGLEISGFKLDNQKLNFTTKINPKQMPSGVYFFTVNVIAADLQKPLWWDEWSSTDVNITDGSKTYNLAEFMRQIKGLTTDLMTKENGQPLVGRFCYAIQRN